MKRRDFFGMLSGLPVVGLLFGKSKPYWSEKEMEGIDEGIRKVAEPEFDTDWPPGIPRGKVCKRGYHTAPPFPEFDGDGFYEHLHYKCNIKIVTPIDADYFNEDCGMIMCFIGNVQ